MCANLTSMHVYHVRTAIPISVTGASLAAQALEGFPVKEWTFLFGRRLFYSTAITASLLTVVRDARLPDKRSLAVI